MHPPIEHNLPYRGMRGNWHGLAEMAAKKHRHEQQCKATRRHPLSLLDNIKIYFINNTRYFNARLNYLYYLSILGPAHPLFWIGNEAHLRKAVRRTPPRILKR